VDDKNRFVITGSGQLIHGINFTSEVGALTQSQNQTSPFPFLLANTPNQVALGIIPEPAEIQGSFVMDFGPTSAAALSDIVISAAYGSEIVRIEPNVVCATCDFPTVTVSDDRELILQNFPEQISEVRLTSAGVDLELLELASIDLPEGTSVTSSSGEVVINSPAGFGAEQLHDLAVVWGSASDAAVFVSFTLLDGTTFGPLPLSLQVSAVPEPQTGFLLLLGMLSLLGFRQQRLSRL
jgi:hypothetical protein